MRDSATRSEATLRRAMLGVVLVAAAALSGYARGPSSQDQFIVGQVIDGHTGQPLAGAVVVLQTPSGPRDTRILTDATGLFVFRGLAPGAYRLSASRAGYLPASYGQRTPDDRPQRLEVGAAPTAGIRLILWRTAVVTGRVTEEDGAPVAGIKVSALPLARSLGVNASFVGTTDEDGRYRIVDLPPGGYIVGALFSTVAARANDAAGGLAPKEIAGEPPPVQWSFPSQIVSSAPIEVVDDAWWVRRSAFFQSSLDPRWAHPIRLASGDVRDGVDVALSRFRAWDVRGRVHAPPGLTGPLHVRVLPASAEDKLSGTTFVVAQAQARADGTFALRGVPAGDYILEVEAGISSRRSGGDAGATAGAAGYGARAPMTVEGDVSDLDVPLEPPVRLRGQIVWSDGDGAPPVQETKLRVSVNVASARPAGVLTRRPTVAATMDGQSFVLAGLRRDRYSFQIGGARGWAVGEVRIDGKAHSGAVEVTEDADLRLIMVPVGSVLAKAISPVQLRAGTRILFFPVNAAAWPGAYDDATHFREAVCGSDGAAESVSLPRGDYYGVALSSESYDYRWRDANRLSDLAARAVRFTVVAGATRSLDLPLRSGRQ